MDRNTVIGFVLLALLFFGYFYYTRQGQLALEKERQHQQDSLNKLKPKIDTSINTALLKDTSSSQTQAVPNILQDSTVKEQLTTIENKVLRITFSNKGGQPSKVELKGFKTFDKKPLILEDGAFNNISYPINVGQNQTAQTSDLLFTPLPLQTTGSGSVELNYVLQTKNGEKIVHQYILSPSGYMIDFNIKMDGANKLLTQNTLNMTWQAKANKVEKDIDGKHNNHM